MRDNWDFTTWLNTLVPIGMLVGGFFLLADHAIIGVLLIVSGILLLGNAK